MRDAVRRVIDDVVEVDEGPEVFPHDVEVAFNAAYDKLLRALDGLDLARDLLAGVRDYSQSKIANDQNEVMKRLTVVASLLLFPTFIVGLYGQNFVHIPSCTGARLRVLVGHHRRLHRDPALVSAARSGSDPRLPDPVLDQRRAGRARRRAQERAGRMDRRRPGRPLARRGGERPEARARARRRRRGGRRLARGSSTGWRSITPNLRSFRTIRPAAPRCGSSATGSTGSGSVRRTQSPTRGRPRRSPRRCARRSTLFEALLDGRDYLFGEFGLADVDRLPVPQVRRLRHASRATTTSSIRCSSTTMPLRDGLAAPRLGKPRRRAPP